MTLHALRLEVGDEDFLRIVRRWADSQAGGFVTTDEFVALAERVPGEQLDVLFEEWLFLPARPGATSPGSTTTESGALGLAETGPQTPSQRRPGSALSR